MDEKEIIKRIRSSYDNKKSESDIIRILQKKGYKLEYIHELIKQAKKPKRIFVNLIILLIIFGSIFFGIYAKYQLHIINEKFEEMSKWQIDISQYKEIEKQTIYNNEKLNDIVIERENKTEQDKVEEPLISIITESEINYFLSYLNLKLLNKHPITQELPIINLQIGENDFYTVIENGKSKTNKGLNSNADIFIDTTNEEIMKAISSNDPLREFSNSIYKNKTSIEMISSNTELFAKGYLSFYESLSQA